MFFAGFAYKTEELKDFFKEYGEQKILK